MIGEIRSAATQAGFWDIFSALGTMGAVLVALGIAIWSIFAWRKERREKQQEQQQEQRKSLAFLKKQILAYLKATKANYENYFYQRNVPHGECSWEEYNKKNFEILEMLFRDSILLSDDDLESFMEFVLYFKSLPSLEEGGATDPRILSSRLNDVIRIFSDK